MAQHKFKVGQLVDYHPNRLVMAPSSREYKVVRLLPAEGNGLLYRIKSPGETFERVAKEQMIASRSRGGRTAGTAGCEATMGPRGVRARSSTTHKETAHGR
jgi:hypothetical protein